MNLDKRRTFASQILNSIESSIDSSTENQNCVSQINYYGNETWFDCVMAQRRFFFEDLAAKSLNFIPKMLVLDNILIMELHHRSKVALLRVKY